MRAYAFRMFLILGCSSPTVLNAQSECQIQADCKISGQECRIPPASSLKYYRSATQKVCRCPRDFEAGVNCSLVCAGGVDNPCYGHGECLYGETSITKNVGGKDVVQTLQAGSCVCDDDWVGLPDSQCSATCSKGVAGLVCSAKGICTPNGIGSAYCACFKGYRGEACEIECMGGYANPCSGHGTCMSDGTCACLASWRTNDCSLGCQGQLGFAGRVACGGHGTCTDAGFCNCDALWRGSACQLMCPNVDGVPCGGNGICNDKALCVCNKGFRGTSCQIECMGGCQNPCNSHGECKADGTCQCEQGWVGESCNIVCRGGEGNTCSLRGTCVAVAEYSQCICNEYKEGTIAKYQGDNCETPVYASNQRDANATVVDTVQTVFRGAETWPLLVPPLIVLGVAITALALRQILHFIDLKIAQAKDHENAMKLAKGQGSIRRRQSANERSSSNRRLTRSDSRTERPSVYSRTTS